MSEPKRTIPDKELDTVVNYMVLKLGYNFNIILPYKDGIAFLAAMEKAEAIEKYYNGSGMKMSKNPQQVDSYTVSQKDYRIAKMNLLLGMDEKEPANG